MESSASPRVSRACQRCRRQKLKCDEARPCTMCVRAGVFCQARDAVNTPRRKKRAVARRQTRVPPSDQHAVVAGADRPYENHGASSSAVGFAVNIFGQRATLYSNDRTGIPGRASPQPNNRADWTLEKMSMPPPAVMEAALRAYFDHMHWFICIFHEPEFMQAVTPLLRQSTWNNERSRGRVIAALTVAAVGLQCVAQESRWPGHSLLASFSLQAASLRDELIAEVRLHVLKLMDECSLEAVQVSLLLGTYFIFHGSPGLAWNMLGLSVRSAYALSMHCSSTVTLPDPILSQVYCRTWNHITVADTYSAMIYGRPASLDAAFCHLHEMTELEDTRLPPTVARLLEEPNANRLMYHTQKYRLYELIRTALNRFRLINLQTPVSPDSFASLVEAIANSQTSLDSWKTHLPTIMKGQYWKEHPEFVPPANENSPLSPEARAFRHLFLQSQILQITYDSAVLFINRPLLEYQARPEFRTVIAEHLPAIRLSLDLSLKAALRVSRVSPAHHESELSLAFVLMNFFTAGVILCLALTVRPFSKAANEAKEGILRIIRASRKLQSKNKIAKHTEQLLTRLLKLSLRQELDNALHNNNESASDMNPREQGQEPSHYASPSQSPRLAPAESCSSSTLKDDLPLTQPQPAGGDAPFPLSGIPADDLGIEPLGEAGNLSSSLEVSESGCYHQIDSYMDETMGAFGEMLFNLVPNDPYSAWNWGSNFRV